MGPGCSAFDAGGQRVVKQLNVEGPGKFEVSDAATLPSSLADTKDHSHAQTLIACWLLAASTGVLASALLLEGEGTRACENGFAQMKARTQSAEGPAKQAGRRARDCMRHEMCANRRPAKCEARAKANRERGTEDSFSARFAAGARASLPVLLSVAPSA